MLCWGQGEIRLHSTVQEGRPVAVHCGRDRNCIRIAPELFRVNIGVQLGVASVHSSGLQHLCLQIIMSSRLGLSSPRHVPTVSGHNITT